MKNIMLRAVSCFIATFFAASFCVLTLSKEKMIISGNFDEKPYKGDLTYQDILKKMDSANKALGNYSFTMVSERKTYLLKQKIHDRSEQGVKTMISAENAPDIENFEANIKFMQPYLHQTEILHSDLAPSSFIGAKLTYRSDKDKNAFWVKAKKVPASLKRKFEKGKGGKLFSSNFLSLYLSALYYSQNGSMSIGGSATVNKIDCVILRAYFARNDQKKWNRQKPPYAAYSIPDQIATLMWNDMLEFEESPISRIDYYIDSKKFVPVAVSEYVGKDRLSYTEFKNLKTNYLKPQDF